MSFSLSQLKDGSLYCHMINQYNLNKTEKRILRWNIKCILSIICKGEYGRYLNSLGNFKQWNDFIFTNQSHHKIRQILLNTNVLGYKINDIRFCFNITLPPHLLHSRKHIFSCEFDIDRINLYDFVCGFHTRLGVQSPIKKWSKSPIFDRNVLRVIFFFSSTQSH